MGDWKNMADLKMRMRLEAALETRHHENDAQKGTKRPERELLDACLDKGDDGPGVFRFMACTMIAETVLEVYVSIKGSYEFFEETSEFWKGDMRCDLGVEGG
ncbi:hypothetical protein FOIG_05426 [Fusarium odoratissimum NRRL 54006]|uniref:Uncharacterized protein n=1 Tax=Fusarium odoratissimum (strain NRRL 54006) TaxID=1089451 RepID=X0JRB8_FUSO5|nr:uncharacterized protein FOIG_05426 [Fusarium odoratissimum NRRL 54006]EXM03758.1 hypothetical protein FOIG_05426 [Fusarium odoratissimum NRRL 54006]